MLTHATLDETATTFGRIDYLFNIAGVIEPAYTVDARLDDIDLHVDVNVKGTMIGTLLACRMMRRQGHGHIVNVASLTGVAPVAGLDIYSATKFAVRGFSLAAAHGLRDSGVRVSVVCPDLVDTPMMEHQLDYDASALAFSGPRPLRPDEVSRGLLRTIDKGAMEVGLPWSRTWLARIGNLLPGAATPLPGMLTAKGRKTMARMRRQRSSGRGGA